VRTYLIAAALIALLPNQLCAQQKGITYHDILHKRPHEIYYINAAGRYHGPYKEYYTDGTLAKDCNYLDGELNGRCTTYYNYGVTRGISEIQNWKKGVSDGLQKSYSDDRKGSGYAKFVRTETLWKDGIQIWRKTYDEAPTGKVYMEKEEIFRPGGSWSIASERGWRSNGHMWYNKSDSGRNFQEDAGTLQMEFVNWDGLKHGYYREWYPGTKQLGVEAVYQYDFLYGPYKEWDRNGKLTKASYYDEGIEFEEIDSTTLAQHNDGNVLWLNKSGVKFAEGNLNGELRKFYSTGQLYKTEYRRDGKLDSVVCWYPDSLLMSRVYYSGKSLDSTISYYDLKAAPGSNEVGEFFPMKLKLRFKSGHRVESWNYCKTGKLLEHYKIYEPTWTWVFMDGGTRCDY
jgi:antitoxin component YwqK of YwqJK toxin-antitoxin module